jgi:hypothetical protein
MPTQEDVAKYERFYAGTRQIGGTVYTGPSAPIAGTHIVTPEGEEEKIAGYREGAAGTYVPVSEKDVTVVEVIGGPFGEGMSMSLRDYEKWQAEQTTVATQPARYTYAPGIAPIGPPRAAYDIPVHMQQQTYYERMEPVPQVSREPPQITPSYQPMYGQRTATEAEMRYFESTFQEPATFTEPGGVEQFAISAVTWPYQVLVGAAYLPGRVLKKGIVRTGYEVFIQEPFMYGQALAKGRPAAWGSLAGGALWTAGVPALARRTEPKPMAETAYVSRAQMIGDVGEEVTLFTTRAGEAKIPSAAYTKFIKEGERTYGVSAVVTDIGETPRTSVVLTKGMELPKSVFAAEAGVTPIAEKALVITPRTGWRGKLFKGFETEVIGTRSITKRVDMGTYATMGQVVSKGERSIIKGVTEVQIKAPLEAFPGSTYGYVSPIPTSITAPTVAGGIGATVRAPRAISGFSVAQAAAPLPSFKAAAPLRAQPKFEMMKPKKGVLKYEPMLEPEYRRVSMKASLKAVSGKRAMALGVQQEPILKQAPIQAQMQIPLKAQAQIPIQPQMMKAPPLQKQLAPPKMQPVIPTPRFLPSTSFIGPSGKSIISKKAFTPIKRIRTYKYTPTVAGIFTRKPIGKAPKRITYESVGIRAPIAGARLTYTDSFARGLMERDKKKKKPSRFGRQWKTFGTSFGRQLGLGKGRAPKFKL